MAKELVRKAQASKTQDSRITTNKKSGKTQAISPREAPDRRDCAHAAKKHAAKKSAAKKSAAKKSALKSLGLRDQDVRLTMREDKHGDHEHKKHHGKKKSKHDEHGKHDKHEKKELDKSTSKAIAKAFHHLQRASAVISLIEPESGGDLKLLLHAGIEIYRDVTTASKPRHTEDRVACALGLLAASEHLAMAGLYAARGVHQLEIEPPSPKEFDGRLEDLAERLDDANSTGRTGYPARLIEMARELLLRAEGADHDPHLAYELTMAVDGLAKALEAGLE